ncbi:transmembrane protein 231-like isoform X2 [Neoarius graeffei]|uniref:transmembrane protein 231-like isoform X2 n=1 Tax=Neoarius graeffei TaxID=443677 RepID=UPI00298BF033|nr:transmembrane protein 231-like isoform X2 [Neoarius graeffei]
MGFYEVYSHPVLIRYKARVCSRASVFVLVVYLLTYIPPLLITYRSQGFWLKQSSYEEQPVVQFQYEMLMMGVTSVSGEYVAWSTFSNFNALLGDKLRIPTVSVQESDRNGDGKADRLSLQMSVPLTSEEQIYSIQLLLTFSYQLRRMSVVVMQSMVLVQASSPVPVSQLFISGDLKLQQKEPLSHRGVHTHYNVSVINLASPFASSYDLSTIIRNYQERNLTTYLSCPVPVWTVGRAANAPFEIKAEIRYPVETVTYRPGFWETLKFAWVQYVSVLLIFLWIFQRIQTFVFHNRVLPTVPVSLHKPHYS